MNEKKRILILEDDHSRMSFFRHQLESRNLYNQISIIHAISIEEFDLFLKFNKPDLIVLDHDLGDDSSMSDYASIHCPNGSNAACILNFDDVPVVVWSHNPDGAKNISNILKSKNIAHVLLPFNKINVSKLCDIVRNLIEQEESGRSTELNMNSALNFLLWQTHVFASKRLIGIK